MNDNAFTSADGFAITAIVLYSTGHWVGATVALLICLLAAWIKK